MIPRHDGLVPVMRQDVVTAGPGPSRSTQPLPPPTLRRYTILLPSQLSASHQTPAYSKASAAVGDVEVNNETRLYSFVPSADCPVAPPRAYATDADDLNRAAELFVNADHGYHLDEDGGGAKGSTGDKREGKRPRRIPMKKGEPCRLTYTTVADSESEEDTESGTARKQPNWRLCSVALPEYEHLTCVLLSRGAQENKNEEPVSTSQVAHPRPNPSLVASVLARPVMELRPERISALDGDDEVHGGGRGRRGISASWLSVPTVKVNAKDWKSMDEMDRAEAAAASRDGKGGDSEEAIERGWTGSNGEDGGDDADSRPSKRARTKAPSKSESATSLRDIQAALVQNRQLLQARREAEEAAERQRHGGAVFTPAPVSASYGYSTTRPTTGVVVVDEAESAEPRPSIKQPEQEGEQKVSNAKTQAANSVRTPSAADHASSHALHEATISKPSSATSAPAPQQGQQSALSTVETLDSCGRAVLTELRGQEDRKYASLKELEKLILRRLPSYESVAVKMKDPSRKSEAVAWFRHMQKELKLWLIQAGCSIDPTGIVTFPLAR